MTLDATYTYHCSIAGCDSTETEHMEAVPKTQIPSPMAPACWREFGTLLLCPRHVIMIDGVEAPPAS